MKRWPRDAVDNLTVPAFDAEDEDKTIEVSVEFSGMAPEPDVGIFGWTSEDHTLHDITTGERLTDLEEKIEAAGKWESITQQIDERSEEWA